MILNYNNNIEININCSIIYLLVNGGCMKKIEAKALAPEKSKLVIEYITQILSDSEKLNSVMDFWYAKIDGQNMCTLDIYVPERNFEKHLNLGITKDHCLVLYEQILNDFLDTFLEHETMGVTRYYSIKSMQENFSGVDAVNLNGSKIKINFNTTNPDFINIVSDYTRKYNEFAELSEIKEQPKLR